MFSGNETSAIRIWRGSHIVMNHADKALKFPYISLLPSRLVVVPPYSILVMRSDVAHAGASGCEIDTAAFHDALTRDTERRVGHKPWLDDGEGRERNFRGHLYMICAGGSSYDPLCSVQRKNIYTIMPTPSA